MKGNEWSGRGMMDFKPGDLTAWWYLETRNGDRLVGLSSTALSSARIFALARVFMREEQTTIYVRDELGALKYAVRPEC